MAGDRDPIGNTGLTERLAQHSRRNGFALGIAMAICILIGFTGFIYLYTHITILPDFTNKLTTTEVPAARGPAGSSASGSQIITPPATTIASGTPNANATRSAAVANTPSAGTASSATTGVGTAANPRTVTAQASRSFAPNFRIAGGFTINFRSDASTSSAVVKTLAPGTELQFVNQTQEVNGEIWRKLRDATGAEGWVRDIDLEKIPG